MTNRLSVSSYASSASMEGFLEKQGGLKVPNLLTKKCWYVLDENKLSYFKDPNKTAAPNGTLDVAKMQSVRMSSAKGFCFEITSGSKTQIFAAPSAELRDRWIRSLQDAMSIASRRPSLSRVSVSSWNSFDEEESKSPVQQVSTPPPVVDNPFTNPALSVIVESAGGVSGGGGRSSSYGMSTPDAPASTVSNADEDCSDVPYEGYINGPQSVTGPVGTVGPGPRYVESYDGDEEPRPSAPVELSTRTSSNSDKLSATSGDGDARDLPTTHSKCLSVVGERGVMMDSTDGTGAVEVINTDKAEGSGRRDGPSEHVGISRSGVSQQETEVMATSRAVDSVVEDAASVLPVPTAAAAIGSEHLARTARDGLDKISPEKQEIDATGEKPPQSAGRMVQRRPTVTVVDKTAAEDTVVVELIVDNSFVPSAVPELQHARIASERESSFDELKSFLAGIHSTGGGSYVRSTERFSSHPGQAISSLKFFLANIE